ncbi:WecB/TagA/CpsF family glycosyltransferase [Aliagarivorans marinus]|uniref:WecB/TagA/CpsF family glycosyltransferase n=1 Tax=Aliagarivorans marinus TaxID=561965 RepID=UPI00040C9BE8|nr:WecB/TagA/CpsF family glycosyltransferase [Aliagarivorans marinus]
MIAEIEQRLVKQPRQLLNPGIYTFINPYSYLVLRKQPELTELLDGVAVDGGFLCWLLRRCGYGEVQRLSFDNTSLAPQVFSQAQAKEQSVYLIGSAERDNRRFVEYLQWRYPQLKVLGHRNGYFANQQMWRQTLSEVVKLAPDIVVCGMGCGLQERFLTALKHEGWQGWGFSCGGFMHQTSRHGEQYYPAWVDRMNLRFAFRIYDEPVLIKRYTVDYLKFAGVFAWDQWRRRYGAR